MIEIETLTEILPEIDPEVEAVHDGTAVGFYKFTGGDYKGIVFTYVNPKFALREDGMLELSFTYVIVDDPNKLGPTTIEEDGKFNVRIGDLLVSIIEAATENSEANSEERDE